MRNSCPMYADGCDGSLAAVAGKVEDDAKLHRPTVTADSDARSGMVLGVGERLCAAVVLAVT